MKIVKKRLWRAFLVALVLMSILVIFPAGYLSEILPFSIFVPLFGLSMYGFGVWMGSEPFKGE